MYKVITSASHFVQYFVFWCLYTKVRLISIAKEEMSTQAEAHEKREYPKKEKNKVNVAQL